MRTVGLGHALCLDHQQGGYHRDRLSAGANDTATATSASFTPTATGYTCFMAAYSGDGNYFASSDTTTEECVNVVSSADTVTTSTPTTATFVLGGSDSDLATVTGNPAGGSPTGNVLFYECGPTTAATPCTSTAHPVGTAVSLVAGPNDTATATSTSFTPTGAGFWCFAADYQGGTSYFGSSDTSTSECFDVTPAPSATGSSPSAATIQLGATATDNVAVTGNATAGSPTGTVTFYACGPEASPASCTSINDPVGSPVHLTVGANDVSTATSPAFTPTATGTWCFASVYGGSTNYSESVDNSTDECFHVTAGPFGHRLAPGPRDHRVGEFRQRCGHGDRQCRGRRPYRHGDVLPVRSFGGRLRLHLDGQPGGERGHTDGRGQQHGHGHFGVIHA